MKTSESINKLAAALAKAQGVIRGAANDSENLFFKSRYSDLAAVWDACREALSTNGLSVSQIVENGEGAVRVHTMLMHSSGQWISGELSMAPVKSDPQGIGSACTYARRYALSAIVGIAPEDDDGNAASGKNGKEQETVKRVFGTTKPSAVVYVTPKQATDFALRFKDSLREDLRSNADTLRHDWLLRKGFVDDDAVPTAKRIPIDRYVEVGKEAVAFAAGL